MIFLFENFAESRLHSALVVGDGVLEVPSTDAEKFPVPTNGEHRFALVLYDGVQKPEIVWAFANPGTGLISVERGAEGTVPKTWRAGTAVVNTPTKISLNYLSSGGSDSWHDFLSARIDDVFAAISSEATIREENDGVLAERVDTVSVAALEAEAKAQTTAAAFVGLQNAWASYQTEVQAEVDEANARSQTAANAAVNAGQAVATLDTFVKTAVGDNAASFASLIESFSDFDEAQVQINTDVAARVGNVESGLSEEILLRSSQYDTQVAVNTSIDSRMGNAESAITTEQSTRAGETSALAGRATNIESEISGARNGQPTLNARIGQVESTAATASGALATRTNQLEAQLNNTAVSGLKSAIEALITTEEGARVSGDSALATRASTLEAQMNNTTGSALQARIAAEETARVNGDNALASRTTTLEAKASIRANVLVNPSGAQGMRGWVSSGAIPVGAVDSWEGPNFYCNPPAGSSADAFVEGPIIDWPEWAQLSIQAELLAHGMVSGATRVYIEWRNAANGHLGYVVLEVYGSQSNWMPVKVEGIWPPAGTAKIIVRFDTYLATWAASDMYAAWRRFKIEHGPVCTVFTDEKTDTQISARVQTTENVIANAGNLDAWWQVQAIAGSAMAGIKARANSVGGSQIGMIADGIALFNTILGVAEEVLKAEGGNVYIKKKLILGGLGEIEFDPSIPSMIITVGAAKLCLGKIPNDNIVFWFGPSQTVGNMRKSNARIWMDTSGAAYWGGQIFSGTISNSTQGSSLSVPVSQSLGPFSTNGNPITVNWSYAYTKWANRYGNQTPSGSTTATIRLYRRVGGGAEALVDTKVITGEATYNYDGEPIPGQPSGTVGHTHMQEYMGGAYTYTDTAGGTQQRTFRVEVAARTIRYFPGDGYGVDNQSQHYGITTSE